VPVRRSVGKYGEWWSGGFPEEVLFRRVRRSEGHVQFHHVSLFLSFSSPTFTLLSR
jgi:hypothetical protein